LNEILILVHKAEKRLEASKKLFFEGFYDDAINRAYFAMFLITKALFKTKKIEVKTHKGLIMKFGQEFVKSGIIEKKFGKILHEAEELREEADYSLFRDITEKETQEILNNAEEFILEVKKFLEIPTL
jgi:uncharacterized protein (UPF0332 family)